MIERPTLPSAAELRRADQAVEGGAGELLETYYLTLANYERRLDEALAADLKQAAHLRTYRYLSVLSGTFLAFASLALCAFGIERHADLLPLAAVLGPVAGLAGVFLWGYRPRDNQSVAFGKPKHVAAPPRLPEPLA